MTERNRNQHSQHNPVRRNKFSDIPGIVTHVYPQEDSALRDAIRAEVDAYLREREEAKNAENAPSDNPPDFSSIPGHIMHVAPSKRGEKS